MSPSGVRLQASCEQETGGPVSSANLVLFASGLSKIYKRGSEQVRALQDISFAVCRGEFVAIVGPSGSGKTTLLHLAGCMDAPASGTLCLLGNPTSTLGERERTRIRREQIGFVFQRFNLLPTLTVAENILLPALFARRPAKERLDELLATVGLTQRRDHRPHELSGGEMQRAAIARALINSPSLLLADEPTGNLDAAATQEVVALFRQLHREGLTLLVVTHNPVLAEAAGRRLYLADGRLRG